MKLRHEHSPILSNVPAHRREGERISVTEANERLDRTRSLYKRALLSAAEEASLRGSDQEREERLRAISSFKERLEAAEYVCELASGGRYSRLKELERRAFGRAYELTSFTPDELCEVLNYSSPETLAQLFEQGQIEAVFNDGRFPSEVFLNEQGLIDLRTTDGDGVSTWSFLMHRAGLE